MAKGIKRADDPKVYPHYIEVSATHWARKDASGNYLEGADGFSSIEDARNDALANRHKDDEDRVENILFKVV